jgi:hypothetical protein
VRIAAPALDAAYKAAITEIGRGLLGDRRPRAAARVGQRMMGSDGVRRAGYRTVSRPSVPIGQGISLLTSP